jgi:hypothetical protein
LDLKTASLWPSLASIRSEFYPEPSSAKPIGSANSSVNSVFNRPSKASLREIMGPIQDLARRRAALADRKFSSDWAPGRLVPIKILASVRPVLLDKALSADTWQAFMVAPECDWAGYSDVLLEPTDEPFDPACGMVQTWNHVVVRRSMRASDEVFGELSPIRMETVREVSRQAASDSLYQHDADPGFIGLRSCPSGALVLTGSPLGHSESVDPRLGYKSLYERLSRTIGQ